MKTKTFFSNAILALAIFANSAVFPQVRSAQQSLPVFMKHQKFYQDNEYLDKLVLNNDMTILVNEYSVSPIVSMQLFVRAGFSEEPAQAPGLASLLASMLHRGSMDRVAGTLAQRVQAMGGIWKYSVDPDFARFEILVPKDQWKKALNLQAEAILNLPLNQEAMNSEGKLLQDQARAFLDDPEIFAREKLLELSFGQARMGKWDYIANTELGKIAKEAVGSFYKSMYLPSRMMLVISGDINAGEALNEIAPVYDRPAPKSKISAPLDILGIKSGFRYQKIGGAIPAPMLFWGFRTPGANSEDRAALEIIQAIVGIGEGSVIADRLQNQKKLVLKQRTELSLSTDFGLLQVQLQVDPKKIDASEIAFLTELELLARHEPDEAEMARAVAQLELRHWQNIQNVTARAQAFAQYERGGDWKNLDAYVSRLKKVKPADVRRVAGKYLNLENCSLFEYLPASIDRNLSVESAKNTFEALIKPSADQEQEEREKETIPDYDIPQAQEKYALNEIKYPFQVASILRGPDLFIREEHTAPIIQMGIFFPGGKLFETKENAGITKLLTVLMARGYDEKGSRHFNRQLEIYGGLVRPIIADDYFGFIFSILSQHVDSGLDLLLDAIKKPVFEKDAVDTLKRTQVAEILYCKELNGGSLQSAKSALFAEFPYSLDANGTEASLSAMTADSLQNWYDTRLKNRKALVVVVGDTKGTSLSSHFVKQFSGSRIQPVELLADYAPPLKNGQTLEGKWNGRGSRIFIGFQAPPADDDDRFATLVMQRYVEAKENFPNIFNLHLDYQPRLRGGSFIAWAASSPGNGKSALDAIMSQMSKMAADPIPSRDFRAAVNEAISNFWIRSQDRRLQIEDFALNILAGKGIEEYAAIPKNLQQVNQNELAEIARKIIKKEKAVLLRIQGQSPPNPQ
jgi:zinc protease